MRTTLMVSLAMGYAMALLAFPSLASTCTGTPGNGSIKGALSLPSQGKNFAPYTKLGVQLGRSFVHATVHDIVTAAYRDLELQYPGVEFIYGQTGLHSGGPMPPHRTHENGTSVDFMVPVRLADGRPAALPRSAANRYGYDAEFDNAGRMDRLQIDFEAIAVHLYQLDRQARKRGAGIARVILDPELTRRVFDTRDGPRIKGLAFMKAKPWVRHDGHYHVDFAIRCAPG